MDSALPTHPLALIVTVVVGVIAASWILGNTSFGASLANTPGNITSG